jgi:hypothetical protein
MYKLNLQMGDFGAALASLKEMQADSPKDVNLVNQLAELTMELGLYDDLKKWIEELKKLDGDSTALYAIDSA